MSASSATQQSSGGGALNTLLALQMGAGLVNVLFGFGFGFSASSSKRVLAVLVLVVVAAIVAHRFSLSFDPKFLTFFLGAVITYFIQELIFCGNGAASAWYGAILSFATTAGLMLSASYSPAAQSLVVFWVSISLALVVCLHFMLIKDRHGSVRVEAPPPWQFLTLFGAASAFALTNGLYLIAAHSLPSLLTLVVLDKVCGSSCIALNSHYMNKGFLNDRQSTNALMVILSSSVFSLAVCLIFLFVCEALGIGRLLVAIPELTVEYFIIASIISVAWGFNALSSRLLRSMQLSFRKGLIGQKTNNLYGFYGLILYLFVAAHIFNDVLWSHQYVQFGVVLSVMLYWVAAVLILRGRG